MNFRKIYCIAAMALMCCTGSMFTSCDDYLDVYSYFDEIFELDSVFKRKEYLYTKYHSYYRNHSVESLRPPSAG